MKAVGQGAPVCALCGHGQVEVWYRLEGSAFTLMCPRCGLLFQADRPGKEELERLYPEGYYRERDEYYFRNRIFDPVGGRENYNLQDFREGLRLLSSFKRPGRLLDVGCGVGIFLELAQQEHWMACGVDISPFAVKLAQERFGLEAYAGNLREVCFPDEEFDCITLWDVFEHLPDPSDQLRELRRILKADGLLLLNTPNGDTLLRSLAHFLYQFTGGRFTYPVRKLFHAYHLYTYTRETLGRMLAQNGFEVVRMEGKPIPLVKARGSKPEKLIVGILSLAERVLGREYELFLLARKRP